MKSDRLRILMVAPQPFFRPRGTPFSVLHRARALVERGHTVDLVTYPFGEDVDLPGLNIFRSRKPPFVHDVKIGPSLAKIVLDIPLFFSTIAALRGAKYDVIHSHEEAAFFCKYLAKRHGLLHVYDMHSSLPQQLSNFKAYNFPLMRKSFEYLEKSVLTSCAGVISICAELEEIAESYCGDVPHAMIENTADDQKVFPVAEENVRKALGLEEKKIILYTGTFEEYQGLDLLLPALTHVLHSHPGAHLLMVGGTPSQIAHFRGQVNSRRLEQAVTCVGTVHPSRIPSFIDAADIIVSPRSRGTNIPLKIYGYLRSGKPLVATNMRTHTQLLTPEVAMLVPPSPEGLAGGITAIFEQPALGPRLAEAASALAAREFADESYVDKVTEFYRRVIVKAATRADGLLVRNSAYNKS